MDNAEWNNCVAAVTEQHIKAFAKCCGYSMGLCRWLHSEKLVCLHDGLFAVPLFDDKDNVNGYQWSTQNGNLVGSQHPLTRLAIKLGVNPELFIQPKGATRPLILGTKKAQVTWVFKSVFDAFAVMDKFGWHKNGCNLRNNTGIIVTLMPFGAEIMTGIIDRNVTVVVACHLDDDDPVNLWIWDILNHAGNPITWIEKPRQFISINDWTRAGATAHDIKAALRPAHVLASPKPLDASGRSNFFSVN
jgi:hypothetical protein